MFPMHFVTTVLQHSNDKLSRQGFRTFQEGDLFRWLGIRLEMTIEPRRGDVKVYWERQAREGSIATSANYRERFGMGRHCFEHILHALSFADELPAPDPWKPIRSLIEAFNQRIIQTISQ
ncbi:TPA: hypothetical protein N0F65_009236 [Lagenidium giganteum]|uniref:PiggyBac transposable element-derived protein domain-containing protein n=1 Tax=Lagenidium giganteum TaxID=4803 RepID=A0AAV2YTH4_9STRA|nr:TPA: hypothetical protein N0F65_009236 [Lagenidium giganteum]